jgi:acyl dehydratase
MENAYFSTAIDDRYFEDYVAGAVHECGSIRVEEEEMLSFARRFDPQPIHNDPEAAKQSVFQGLIASGWHTASLMMRLFAEQYLSRIASLSSPGVDELRWLKPVRPGDELSLRVTVVETRRSRSKPDRGIVRSYMEARNQRGEIVMTMEGINLLGCRKTLKT